MAVGRSSPGSGDTQGVLRLSELLGRRVTTSAGTELGRLHDLVVGLGTGATHPAVRSMVTHDGEDHRFAWDVRSVGRDAIIVDDLIATRSDALTADELLLRRDVLDVQVVDIAGHRVARVGDVLLSDDTSRPEVAAIEIGVGSVLDRLGLERLGRRAERRVLDWHAIHLTSERGHTVQLGVPRSAVHLLDADGLAALLHQLDTASAVETITAVDRAVAAPALESAHRSTTERILRALPRHHASRFVDEMSEPGAETWRRRLAAPRPRGGRRYFRSSGWRRHHRHDAR